MFKNKRFENWLRNKKWTNIHLSIEYWALLGFSEAEIIEKIKFLRNFQQFFEFDLSDKHNWNLLNLEKRCLEIQQQILSFEFKNIMQLPNNNCSPTSKYFWIFRGWSEEEAIEKVRSIQSKNSRKKLEKVKQNPKAYAHRFPTNTEYWLKYTNGDEEKAQQLLSKKQCTFSLEKCIAKYGEEEGLKVWNARQNKWQDTLNSKSLEEKTLINKSKGRTFEQLILKFGEKHVMQQRKLLRCKRSYSKAESEFFSKLIPFLRDLNIDISNTNVFYKDNQFGILSKNKRKSYFYDFTILDYKIILEYHGTHVHPNPNWKNNDLQKWQNWKHVFNKQNAETKYAYDMHRRLVAESEGFTLIEIYSDEINIDFLQNELMELINEKNKSNHKTNI